MAKKSKKPVAKSTLSREDSRANGSPPADEVKASEQQQLQPTDQDSSGSCSGSSASADRLGFALRTQMCSGFEARTSCSLSWRRSATPHGHAWWVLSTPERHTSA